MENISKTLKLQIAILLFHFLSPYAYAQPEVQDVTFKFNHFEQIKDLPFDKVVNNIKYVPLETTSECLLEAIRDVVLTKNYLIVNSKNNIFLFTKDGKFLRKIGIEGRGPHEYTFVFNILFNEKDQTIYLVDTKKILIFDLDGKFIRLFNHSTYMKKYRFLADDLIVADRMIEASDQARPYCLYFFDDNGNELKKIQSRCELEKQKGKPFMYDLIGGINYGKDKLYFIEQYGDTIYEIRKDMNLRSIISLNYGKYKFTQEMNYNWNKYNTTGKNYIHLTKFAIFDNKILSSFRYDNKDYYAISYLKENRTILPLIREDGPLNGGFVLPGTVYPIKPFFGKDFLFTTIWPMENDVKGMLLENISSTEGKKRIEKWKENDNPVLIMGFY